MYFKINEKNFTKVSKEEEEEEVHNTDINKDDNETTQENQNELVERYKYVIIFGILLVVFLVFLFLSWRHKQKFGYKFF
jgi:hypothetical protein